MALKKIIKIEDPEDITKGYAGAVWDVVKMTVLIGSALGFAAGITLKGKLMMLGAGSWLSGLIVFAVLFLTIFGGLWFAVKELATLARSKDAHESAAGVSERKIAGWLLSGYAVAYSATFFFAVMVDFTAEALRPFGAGEYLFEFPAALIFFYAVFPAVVVIVPFSSWIKACVKKSFPEV